MVRTHGVSQRRSPLLPILKLLVLVGLALVAIASNSRTLTTTPTVEVGGQASLLYSVPRNLGIESPSFSLIKPFQGYYNSPVSTADVHQSSNNKDAGRFKPFSCSELLNQLKTNTAPVQDPNLGKMHARLTKTNPNFMISLHNETFDVPRWGIMKDGRYYETRLTKAFQDVLREAPPGSRVIDVGGNIGFFSLVSASMGPFILDTFEPNIKNRMRYCESLAMNRWFQGEFDGLEPDGVNPVTNLYHYGIGKEEGKFLFMENTNPGQGAFVEQQAIDPNAPNALEVITLDDFAKERNWFETKPDIAVLKVDVEGLEYAVIEGAKELLRAHLIKNIFMEVSVRTPEETEKNRPFIEFLSTSGYKLYETGTWWGPDTIMDWPNDDQLADKILEKASLEAAKQLNLWWNLL